MRRIQARGIQARIALLVVAFIRTSLGHLCMEQAPCQPGVKIGVGAVSRRRLRAFLISDPKALCLKALRCQPDYW